jgi:hypothetical protein
MRYACMCVVAATMSMATVCSAVEDRDAGVLIDGVVARFRAVVSGRISYHVSTQIGNAAPVASDVSCSFSGDSWSERSPGDEGVSGSHDGKYFEFGPTAVLKSGERRYSLNVAFARTAWEANSPRLPLFAGSFWAEHTADYIDRHRGECRIRASDEIDGLPVTLLACEIPASDAVVAFGEVDSILNRGGTLRMWVSPAFGFVLPRVEYISTNGTVKVRYEASDFLEAASAIYIPRRSRYDFYNINGENIGHSTEYAISKVDLINDAVPEGDFTVTVPYGSVVADMRPADGTVSFFVGENSAASYGDLNDIARFQVEQQPRAPFSTWQVALIVANGVVLLLAVVFVWRAIRKRRALQ